MQATQSSWEASDWLALTSIVALAVLVRAVFFTGFYGSDEVTYTLAGVEIANGIWKLGDCVGSLRYGVNIPVGVFIKLFGPGEIPAGAWSFLCSVGEVVLVFIVAHSIWGRKAAVLSALVIATLPLHVHLAGRLMGDSPLAFFIALSFVLFLFAESRQSTGLYLASGLAAARFSGFGNGEKVTASLQAAASWLPKRIGSVADKRLNELRTPEPASVYEVSAACALSLR